MRDSGRSRAEKEAYEPGVCDGKANSVSVVACQCAKVEFNEWNPEFFVDWRMVK